MYNKQFFSAVLFTLFSCTVASSQTAVTVMQLFSARWYNGLEGEARLRELKKLKDNQWFAIDTFYGMNHRPEKPDIQTSKTYLAPYQDEHGNVVHLVPEVAPLFPGGKKAMELFKTDVLGAASSGPDGEVQKNIYIRCTIKKDGSIGDVVEAQQHGDNISKELIDRCLDAVRYMPAWKPGMDRGRPVDVCVLLDFALKE